MAGGNGNDAQNQTKGGGAGCAGYVGQNGANGTYYGSDGGAGFVDDATATNATLTTVTAEAGGGEGDTFVLTDVNAQGTLTSRVA